MEYPTFSQPPLSSEPVEGVGFLIRAVAKIIDRVIHFVTSFLFLFLAGFIIALVTGGEALTVQDSSDLPVLQQLIFSVLNFIGFLFYGAISEAYAGSTMGKLILGLFVVNKKGEQISFGAGLVRGLLFPIDGMIFGLVGYLFMKQNPLQQRLGDRAAGSLVVKRSIVAGEEKPSGCMSTAAIFIAILFDGVIAAFSALLLVK